MDIVYNVVIPIITSLLGGIIGGLFTFLGVKMTITHERKTREEDLKIKQVEQKKQETERTIERNKRIILTRPELTLTKSEKQIKAVKEFCLLPYVNPKLFDEKMILFGYPNEIFKEEFWDKYELIFQNTGRREIVSAFIQLPYKSYVNIYGKEELMDWQNAYFSNYYSDERSLPSNIRPNEKIKIIVYFPKSAPKLEDVGFDLYICDEDDNYWYQRCINDDVKRESEITAPDTFYMHKKEDYYYWFIYDSFYYSKQVKKCFKNNLNTLLLERKEHNWAKAHKQDKFIRDVKNGEIALNYKLPLE